MNAYQERDKRLNKPEFNRKAKKRRLKEKHDAKNRRKNQIKKRLARR